MTTPTPDPAQHWAHLLTRLDGRIRDVVVESLRQSEAEGREVGEHDVRLLVAYAGGEITAREYAREIAGSLGIAQPGPAPRRRALSVAQPPPAPELADAQERRQVRREDAVQAYVTGAIPVAEFLRIARG